MTTLTRAATFAALLFTTLLYTAGSVFVVWGTVSMTRDLFKPKKLARVA